LAATALFVAGSTLAVWSVGLKADASTVASRANRIYLEDVSGGSQQATANDLELAIEFTRQDAAALKEAAQQSLAAGTGGTVTWGKTVVLRGEAYGTAGFGYQVELPSTPLAGYSAGLTLFKVAGSAQCVDGVKAGGGLVAVPGGGQPPPADLSKDRAIDTGYKGQAKTYEQWFCLVTTFSPVAYSNTATATASGGGQTATSSDTWEAFIYPDPATQSVVAYKFKVTPLGA
jgi:hypothetical protein